MAFLLIWVFLELLFWSWSSSLPRTLNRQEVGPRVRILSALPHHGSVFVAAVRGWVWYS